MICGGVPHTAFEKYNDAACHADESAARLRHRQLIGVRSAAKRFGPQQGDNRMSHVVFNQDKKVNLETMLKLPQDSLRIQPTLRFSPGTEQLPEELHHETSYEVFIPLDGTLVVKICNLSAETGTTAWTAFREVVVTPKQGLVILPRHCHKVVQARQFVVLKPIGSFKISRNAATQIGECPYSFNCLAQERCPSNEVENSQ